MPWLVRHNISSVYFIEDLLVRNFRYKTFKELLEIELLEEIRYVKTPFIDYQNRSIHARCPLIFFIKKVLYLKPYAEFQRPCCLVYLKPFILQKAFNIFSFAQPWSNFATHQKCVLVEPIRFSSYFLKYFNMIDKKQVKPRKAIKLVKNTLSQLT